MKRVMLVLFVAVVLGAVFVFRWWLPSERVANPIVSLPDTRLDYRLEDYQAQFYDQQGEPELQVRGPQLEHDAESRIVTMIEPEFQLSTETAPWLGRADLGEFDRGFDQLSLTSNVELWQDLAIGRLTLVTESLQHLRPARTISSDQPVQIQRPGTKANANGLMIRLDTETVELSDDVYLYAKSAATDD